MVSTLETWKTTNIPTYEVSNLGRVRSKDRMVDGCAKGTKFKRIVKGKILKPWVTKNTGYMKVSMSDRRHHSVHRLVALAFCDGYFEGAFVNHKNGNRSDNNAENLEFVTHQENLLHAFRVLGVINKNKGKTGKNASKSYPVIATPVDGGEPLRFDCGFDAIRAGVGKDSGAISKCCNGKSKLHNGYLWRFVND